MATATALQIDNGLAQVVRDDLAQHLTGVLDAVYSLMIRTHAYHWNVEGPLFEPVHKLTEAQYTRLFADIDDIAERVRALDGKPAVNVNAFPSGVANLPKEQSAELMIADLIRQHESVVRLMRTIVGAAGVVDDVVTADLLTGMMAQHEKDVWMLRAILKR
jgi:starvation-inducible DNA-binding protein